MLVVTANWAVPDGRVCAPPPRRLFERLFTDLRRAAARAGFRRDGRYQPIERVVIVLAGDTFDCLVSDRWLGGVRPWERRREAAARHADLFRDAWSHARRPLVAVARLARRGLAVPAAGAHGRPVQTAAVTVPVRVVMLAGDRDAAVERSGRFFPWNRLGIGVGHAWGGEAVRVVHGASADPLASRDAGPTLLESLAVDLLARFGAGLVAQPGAGDRKRRLVRGLAAGHPLDMPLSLRNFLPLATDGAAEATRVADIWRRSVDQWVREARRWGCAADDHGALEAIAWWMATVERDAQPRPAADKLIHILATPLPFGGGQALTVAGHIGHGAGDAASRIVCLGPATIRSERARASFSPQPSAVACIRGGHTVGPAALPAVAIFEAGEGSGRTAEWLTACDSGGPAQVLPEAVPILDAA